MSNDPVLWVKHGNVGAFAVPRVWNREKQRYERPTDDSGIPLRERVPAVGFVGRDLSSMRRMSGSRSARYLNHAGNEIHLTLTNAASIAARDDDPYRNDRIRKARHFGWIPVGGCPCAERFRGMNPTRLLSKEARTGTPCPDHAIGIDEDGNVMPPCEHYLAEMDARRVAQARKNTETTVRLTQAEERQANAMTKLAEAQEKQASAMTALAGQLISNVADAPSSAPPRKGDK